MAQFFTKTCLMLLFASFFNRANGQNQQIVAGQIAQMSIYNFQKTTILDDYTNISLDSVGIAGAPVYDFKIASIGNGVANNWLSYQILQKSPAYPFKQLEIAVSPFNQFSANVARFEENEPIFDVSANYQWEKAGAFTMFFSNLQHENDTTKLTAGTWTDTLPHFMAFRYFGQNYLDTLYGYIKMSVKSEFLISQTSLYQLAIQNPILATFSVQNRLSLAQIFPNPAQNFLQIDGLKMVEKAQIVNSTGQILWSKVRLDLTNFRVETAHFPTGNYWFQVFDGQNKRQISFEIVH